MQRTLIGILSLLFVSFLFAVPASAANLPQCSPFPNETTEFALIAENNIIFEPQQAGSGRIINGNVLVTNPTVTKLGSDQGTGFVKVGANTNIQGTAIAETIILPDGGATITHCIANHFVANTPAAKASCGSGFHAAANADFTNFGTAHPTCVEAPLGTLTFSSLCGPTPVKNACADVSPPLTVAPGDTLTLASGGCFGDLTLGNGAVLNLSGTFTFKSVKMNSGAKMIGPATVNVNGAFKTDAGVVITNIDLNVAFATTAEVVSIFNNSVLTNVVINAPFGKCHLHTGTDLAACSEACCKVLDVEPITAECVPVGEVCTCPDGFVFQVDPNSTDPDSQLKRSCVAK